MYNLVTTQVSGVRSREKSATAKFARYFIAKYLFLVYENENFF